MVSASLAITFQRRNDASLNATQAMTNMRFNRSSMHKEIEISESLPPASYIYTFSIPPLSSSSLVGRQRIGELPTLKYHLSSGEKFFTIDEESGVLSSRVSLRGADQQNV